MEKFHGTIEELQAYLAERGCDGKWSDIQDGHQFSSTDGAKLSWYPRKGKVVYGGPQDVANRLKDNLAGTSVAENRHDRSPLQPVARIRPKVFVVYGHDSTARAQVEAMLRRWELEPLILDQLPSEGQTIIEKLMKYTKEDVGFAVVLATPDDEGNRIGKTDEKKYRARQNVILELGLLLGMLGREKVGIFIKSQEEMERPSDIHGLIYLPFVNDVEESKLVLAKEMQKQGIHLDLSKL
jgi:predicted nucleotide-binding protein